MRRPLARTPFIQTAESLAPECCVDKEDPSLPSPGRAISGSDDMVSFMTDRTESGGLKDAVL
jgi:hypothetical protein